MTFVLGGLGLALLYSVVSLCFLGTIEVEHYLDIRLLCETLGQDGAHCKAGATVAAYTLVGGLCMAFLLATVLVKRFERPEVEPCSDVIFPVVAVPAVVLLGAHIISQITTTQGVSRIEVITHYATLISLENLLWPLLIQLSVSARNPRYRMLYISLLLPVVAMSPFRGVILAFFIFAVAIPGINALLGRGLQSGVDLKRIAKYMVVATAFAAMFVGALYLDTAERETNLEVSQNATSQLQAKITQRVAFPLFQAYAAQRFSEVLILPGPLEEILKKFRLTDKQNLNEYLYSMIYGGGTVGETTSLYYGEAIAASVSHPIVWTVVGPLSLVWVWLLLLRVHCDAGALIGIAIWRGSLGGVSSVIPALVIQIAIMLLLMRWSRRPSLVKPASEKVLP